MATLEDLPAEMVWEVTSHLSDKDFAALRASSRRICASVEASNGHIWRSRFLATYDHPEGQQVAAGPSNTQLMRAYQQRKFHLFRRIDFTSAPFGTCWCALIHLLTLISESFSNGGHFSLNIGVIQRFCATCNFVLVPLNARVKEYMSTDSNFCMAYNTLMAMLFPLSLDIPYSPHSRLGDVLAECQRALYCASNQDGLFLGASFPAINMDWLTRATIFWRYHLRHDYLTLKGQYDFLMDSEKIRCWEHPLVQQVKAQPIGNELLGAWSFLADEQYDLAEDGEHSHIVLEDHFMAHHNDDHIFKYAFTYKQPSEIDITDWPPALSAFVEPHLNPDPDFIHNCLFVTITGSREVGWNFEGKGWLSPLLEAEGGFYGWQRMVCVSYDIDQNGQQVPNNDSWHVHEAIVMPGGNVMFGRFWAAGTEGLDRHFSPFIMWNVSGSAMEE